MSSDIFSRKVDVSKYALIYGGAQKNVGPAGVSFNIVRKDSLGKVSRYIPYMLDYSLHLKNESMYNTPPVFAIYVMNETLKWVKSMGGVAEISKINEKKAELLYAEIDRNSIFRATASFQDRSLMNVCFVLEDDYKEKEADFIDFAKKRNIIGIKGHRLVGGFRTSIYNACPLESVQALVEVMKEYEKEVAL